MNDKYSLAKCTQYGRRLATRLCDQYFDAQAHAAIDGPGILKFTPVRQLNLLVMRQLLGQWQAETTRLRSPYFDFEVPPVQMALTQFMNVLSRHISLSRTAFEPLLAQAATDTLGLAADSQGSFQRLLLGTAETPTLESLRDGLRYLDFDKAFYQGFLDSLSANNALTRDFLIHRFELYYAANYRAHQPMQRLVEELSALLPLTTADLLEDGPVSTLNAASADAKPAVETLAEPVAIPPLAQSLPVPTRPAALAAPVATMAAPAAAAPIAAPPETLSPPTPAQPLPDTGAANVPLHEKLRASQPPATALADTLRATAAPASQAERAGPKVETLREAISINQRFSFINELFNGENMDYHAAIQHLDSLPTAEQARAYVATDLGTRYDWSRKEEHVNKLLKLIERKFA
ncbi:MAG: hypothetical protein M3Y54_08820 [Bacteroidota bacterium]|nr:hypothetical protein [Bacteroidota bacterium]